MSAIGDKLTATPQGRLRAAAVGLPSMLSVSEDWCETTAFSHQRQYRIEVRLGGVCFINEPVEGALAEAVIRTKLALNEEIFGEFRMPLILALQEIRYGEPAKAIELIDGVMRSMFDGVA